MFLILFLRHPIYTYMFLQWHSVALRLSCHNDKEKVVLQMNTLKELEQA